MVILSTKVADKVQLEVSSRVLSLSL